MSDTQEYIDLFYWTHGPCCAGCDWWRHINSLVGDCTATPPSLPGKDRAAALGMRSVTVVIECGHALTKREHHCGAFKDEFDWSSLNPVYLKRIGATPRPQR